MRELIMISGGASVDVVNSDGFTLLYNAIRDGDGDGAVFLLNNGADIDLRQVSPFPSPISSNLQSFPSYCSPIRPASLASLCILKTILRYFTWNLARFYSKKTP